MSAIQETQSNLSLPSLCNTQYMDFPIHRSSSAQDLFEMLLDDSNYEITCMTQNIESPKKTKGCRCSKTGCIKMYCECYSKGKQCTKHCSCVSCCNHSNSHVSSVRRRLSKTNSTVSRTGGCTCKKTGCEKKYCECFAKGEKCSDLCICKNCSNCETVQPDSQSQLISLT